MNNIDHKQVKIPTNNSITNIGNKYLYFENKSLISTFLPRVN